MAKRREFTDADVAALPFARPGLRHPVTGKPISDATRYHVMDRDCRGLVIRVAQNSRSYNLQMRDADGRPIRRAIGKCDTIKIADARAKANEWRTIAKGGLDPKAEEARKRREAQARLTNSFEAVAREFLMRHLAAKNRTWKESARQLGLVPDPKKPDDLKSFRVRKGGLVEKWGDRQISEIRRAEIIELLDEIVDAGAPILANRMLALLRKMFNWAASRDKIEKSPCAGVDPPSEEKSRDRVLTPTELQAVWAAAGVAGYPFGTALQLLILTGQRKSEVAGMRWNELDIANRVWKLPPGRVKNDTGHEVPLSNAVLEIIETIPRVKGRDFVFSTTGTSAVSGFSKAKDTLDKKSGVANWRIHDLRRTVATGMADLGIGPHIIEAVLNHVSGHRSGVAGIYNRSAYTVAKRHALTTWAEHVTSVVNAKVAQPQTVRARA